MTSTERHEKRYQRRKAEREAKRRKRLDEYDSFERISSPGALLKANIASRKGVLFKANVIRYNVHAFRNAIQVSRMDTLFLGLFNSSPWKNKNEKRRKYA